MSFFKTAALMALTSTLLTGVVSSRADTPSTHGMLLFGQKTVYASHLPMFHSPHDYQVILKITLSDLQNSGASLEYQQLQDAHQAGIFTLVPEVMDLTQVIAGTKQSFKAQVFQGHFERGGTKLGAVLATVEKIVYSAKLAKTPSTETSESYLVFGSEGDYYAFHLISGKPSFDSVLKVKQPIEIFVTGCRTRVCADPKETPVSDAELPVTVSINKQNASVNLAPKSGDALGLFNQPQTTVLDVIYLEEEELSF